MILEHIRRDEGHVCQRDALFACPRRPRKLPMLRAVNRSLKTIIDTTLSLRTCLVTERQLPPSGWPADLTLAINMTSNQLQPNAAAIVQQNHESIRTLACQVGGSHLEWIWQGFQNLRNLSVDSSSGGIEANISAFNMPRLERLFLRSLSPRLDGIHGLVELRLHSFGVIDVAAFVGNPGLQVLELNTGEISNSTEMEELWMTELHTLITCDVGDEVQFVKGLKGTQLKTLVMDERKFGSEAQHGRILDRSNLFPFAAITNLHLTRYKGTGTTTVVGTGSNGEFLRFSDTRPPPFITGFGKFEHATEVYVNIRERINNLAAVVDSLPGLNSIAIENEDNALELLHLKQTPLNIFLQLDWMPARNWWEEMERLNCNIFVSEPSWAGTLDNWEGELAKMNNMIGYDSVKEWIKSQGFGAEVERGDYHSPVDGLALPRTLYYTLEI